MMKKKILIISGSPKKNGNTDTLVKWFCEGIPADSAEVEVTRAAELKLKIAGCASCRVCQTKSESSCVIDDDVRKLQARMREADVIVMATPLYFFSMSAQLKVVIDRMFSLYKWDNAAGTMQTVLKGKKLVLLASAFEDVGLADLAKPFVLTAEYTGMGYDSLLVPNAGVSGEIVKLKGIREKALALGRKVAE